MTERIQAHETMVSLVTTAPAELYAGIDIPLKVKVSCPSSCNLQGTKVSIVADEGAVVKEIELVSFDGTANETAEFVVKVPSEPGAYRWTAAFPTQEGAAVLHMANLAPFSFSVKPHPTNVQVWDVPSPLVFGAAFKVKVGVQCAAGCNLTGSEVAIYDYKGVMVASGTLGNVPWSKVDAQYCEEMELKAPGTEGRYMWEVKFPKPNMALPHEESACTFTSGVAGQPEHVVTVEVIDRDSKAPIEKVNAILRPSIYRGSEYSGYTDDTGVARIRVPKGEYHICAAKGGYKSFLRIAEIAGDTAVKAALCAGSDLDDIFG